jgi:hypothetical protein
MVYVDSWDEFVERSVQLFRTDPIAVRRGSDPPFSPILREPLCSRLVPSVRSKPNIPRVPADPLCDEVPALRGEARAQGHRRSCGTVPHLPRFAIGFVGSGAVG